jgi:hypothetical protein
VSHPVQLPVHEADECRVAWQAVCQVIGAIRRGGRPTAMPPTVRIRPGEQQFGDLAAEAFVYTEMDVRYQTGGYAFGGSLLFVAAGMAAGAVNDYTVRNRAQALAQAQWRRQGQLRIAVTSHRLLLMSLGTWNARHLRDLVSIQPDPGNWSVVLHFDEAPPLLLRGPWVPWLTAVVCAMSFGRPWPNGSPPPIPIPPRRPAPGHLTPSAAPRPALTSGG